jgi:hypothetical protein
MKRFINIMILFTLLVASCKKETPEPPAPSGTGTVKSLTPMETAVQGNWHYERREIRYYGYPPYYPHDTLLGVIIIQTYSDTACGVQYTTAVSSSHQGCYEGTDRMTCAPNAMYWREINSNGVTCLQMTGANYGADTLTATKLVLKYPGDEIKRPSYIYHYFSR